MADPNIICYIHNKVQEILCNTPRFTNGLCSNCWKISDRRTYIMPLGIDFLCPECILIGKQRGDNINKSLPESNTLRNNVIKKYYFQKLTAQKISIHGVKIIPFQLKIYRLIIQLKRLDIWTKMI